MIQEELRNFIEQNCSGKEPSDLIMEAIGNKIEQLGADADEVLAFVEECVKGPTLEQKAEVAKESEKTVALLKYILRHYINYVEMYDKGLDCRGEMIPVEQFKENNELHPYYYKNPHFREDGRVRVFYQIDVIKEEADLYRNNEEIKSLLEQARHKEASIYFEAAMSQNGRITRNANKYLSFLKKDYSDIATQQIAVLEEKIAQAKQQKADKVKHIQDESEDNDELEIIRNERKKLEVERKKLESERKLLEEERNKIEIERKKLEEERSKLEVIVQKDKEQNSLFKKFFKK